MNIQNDKIDVAIAASIFNPLLNYDWPGNVRELRNFAERVVILADKNKLERNFIKEMMSQKYKVDNIPIYMVPLTNNLSELERDYIKFLLDKFGGNREKVCDFLNISRSTLWRKLNNS